jgi:hypothetical protein
MFACYPCKFETTLVSEFTNHLQTKHSESDKSSETEKSSESNPSSEPGNISSQKVKVELIPGIPSTSKLTQLEEAARRGRRGSDQISGGKDQDQNVKIEEVF